MMGIHVESLLTRPSRKERRTAQAHARTGHRWFRFVNVNAAEGRVVAGAYQDIFATSELAAIRVFQAMVSTKGDDPNSWSRFELEPKTGYRVKEKAPKKNAPAG